MKLSPRFTAENGHRFSFVKAPEVDAPEAQRDPAVAERVGTEGSSLWNAMRLLLASRGLDVDEVTLRGWSGRPFAAGLDPSQPARVAEASGSDWERIAAIAGLRYLPLSGGNANQALRDLQEELDRAYDQSRWVPDVEAAVARYGALSQAARTLLPPRTLRYGDGVDETLHLFQAAASGAPVQVFIHGGGWRSLSKEDAGFPARTFVEAGAHYIALDFTNMPRARLPEMVAQVRRAGGAEDL